MAPRYALIAIALLGACGCAGVGHSKIFHPGPAEYQQRQAERFDPFPMTDVGPDMQARPRAFLRPAPENERVQNPDSYAEKFHQPPPPGVFRDQRANPGRQVLPYPTLPAAPTAPPAVEQQFQSAPFFVP